MAGDLKEWVWFKIYVFSKEDVDLVEELKKLNSLLVSHNMDDYGEFLVCIDQSLLSDTAFAFLSKKKKEKYKVITAFDFLVSFWGSIGENGSMT